MSAMTIQSKAVDKIFTTLGIQNVREVRSFKLDMTAGDIVRVRIEFFPSEEQMVEIGKHIKHYKLEQI